MGLFTRRQTRATRPVKRTQLGIESLETREMLAADLITPDSLYVDDYLAEQATYSTLQNHGSLSLRTIPELAKTELKDITIESPVVHDDGSITGTVHVGGFDSLDALVQRVDPVDGTWMIALKARSFTDVLPSSSILKQFNVGSPILAYSMASYKAHSTELSPQAAEFFGDVYAGDEFSVNLDHGLNVLTSVGVRDGSLADQALRPFVGQLPRLMIQGVALKNLSGQSVLEAINKDTLRSSLQESLELRAILDGFNISGLPQGWSVSQPYFYINGSSQVGLGFNLNVQANNGRTVSLVAQAGLITQADKVGFVATATLEHWQKAFDIRGLNLNKVVLQLKVTADSQAKIDANPKLAKRGAEVSIGFSAAMEIGTRNVHLAGKLTAGTSGVEVAFRAAVDTLSARDLVTFAEKLMKLDNPNVPRLPRNFLPDIELRNASINFAPKGGDVVLGIKSGIGASGELWFNGKRLATTDVLMDPLGGTFQLKLDVPLIDLAVIKVQNVNLDILVGPTIDSHFIFSGQAEVFGSRHAIDIHVSRQKMSFEISANIPGVGMSNVRFSSPTAGSPDWTFSIHTRDDLGRSIQEGVRSWANASKAEFDKALADLNRAQADVNRIDGRLTQAREQAQREFDRFTRDLQNLQRDIDAAQLEVDKLKPGLDLAYQNWLTAVQATKDAPFYEAWLKKIEQDAALLVYAAQSGLYETATLALDVAQDALTAFRNGAGWMADALTVEANPSVIALKAEKAIATGVLNIAREIVNGFTTATSDVLGSIANAFSVRETRITGRLTSDLTLSLSIEIDSQIGSGRITTTTVQTRIHLNDLRNSLSPERIAGEIVKKWAD